MKKYRAPIYAIAIFVLFLPVLKAQILGARVEGVVRDPSSAVVAGATVTASNQDTGQSRTASSDAQGRYVFNDLPPGRYDISFSLAGFKSTVRQGVTLSVGAEVTVDQTLEVGGVAEQVVVVAEAPQVETRSGTISGVVEEKVIRDLPLNGRSFANLAQLQPGVVISKAGTQGTTSGTGDKMSLGGARPHQMSFLIDGADMMGKDNTTPSGVSGVMMGVDTIQEFRVSTSNFSAEFGRNSGGVISAITKSGTNNFHGTAFEFLRNNDLDARNFYDRGSAPPAFRRNQFGGTFGGPVRKDKTFVFGGYEGLRESLGLSGVGSVPTADGRRGILPGSTVTVADSIKPYLALYPLPNGPDLGGGIGRYFWSQPRTTRQDDYMARVDHQLGSNDSLMGRVFFDDSNRDDFDLNNSLGLLSQLSNNRIQSYVGDYKRIFGSSTVNDLRAAFNRTSLTLADQIPSSLTPLEFVPGRDYGVLTQQGFSSISSNATNPRFWTINTFQYIDDAVIAKGRHTLKFGGQFERIQLNEFSVARFRGEYQFTSLQTFLTANPSRLEVGWANSGTRGLRQSLFGLYFQDDVKVSPRLALNLGVRYEDVTVPTEAAGRISTLRNQLDPKVVVGDPWWNNPGLKNFAPRVGFAYDLKGDGKTAIRGGYGIFYDQLLPIYWRDSNSRMLPFISRFVVTPANVPGGVIPFPHGYTLFTPGPTLSDPNVEVDLAAPFHTKQPYTMQYNFTLQRQLAPNLSLMVGYMGSQSRNNSRNVNWNTCLPAGTVDGQPFFAANCPRRNPNFAVVFQHLFDAVANYNSLQVALRKRYSHGFNFDMIYQYARTMDEMSGIGGSTDFGNITSFSMDPENARRDYGRAAFDIRHYLTFNTSYEIPYNKTGLLHQVLGGWRISSLTVYSAGEPFTAVNNFDRSGAQVTIFGNQERPNLAPGGNNNPVSGTTAGCTGVKAGQRLGKPDLWFDPCQFALQPAGFFGNLGRNTLQGPNLITEDLGLLKDFSLGEARKLEFRWEVFNLFNKANFDLNSTTFRVFLNATTRNPNAGQFTGTRTPSRQMQFALKFIF